MPAAVATPLRPVGTGFNGYGYGNGYGTGYGYGDGDGYGYGDDTVGTGGAKRRAA